MVPMHQCLSKILEETNSITLFPLVKNIYVIIPKYVWVVVMKYIQTSAPIGKPQIVLLGNVPFLILGGVFIKK